MALLMTALDGFHHLPLVAAAAAGGLAADRFAPLMPPAGVLAVASVVLWGTFFAVYAAVWGLAWEPELWGGALVLCVLSAIGLGAVTSLTSSRPLEPAGSRAGPRSFAPAGR